jgi:hypothetical protein
LSTQQILGVVGGVVGAFFGYPQLGFVVGSLVGGLLTPGEKTEGPRVDDLKVQVSTYGAGIPILYGTERIGGNVVWSTDKIETESTETQGKGGAPEHTTYRYFVHMGIVLCETPRDGSTVNIVQIYQDGKLIFDARSGIPIGSALASAENPHAFFVMYQGHADQLPDPIEELYEDGPGSVPAYRGVVRIRMNAIECPGGRVPQYSFVLTTTAASAVTSEFASIEGAAVATATELWGWDVPNTDPRRAQIFRAAPGEAASPTNLVTLGTPSIYFAGPYAVNGHPAPTAMYAIGEQTGIDEYDIVLNTIDLQTGALLVVSRVATDGSSTPRGVGTIPHAAYEAATGRYAVTRGFSELSKGMTIIPTEVDCDMTDLATVSPIAFYDGIVYGFNSYSSKLVLVTIDPDSGAHMQTYEGPTVGVVDVGHSTIQVDGNGIFVHGLMPGGGAHVYKVEISGATSTWNALPGLADFVGPNDPGAYPASQGKFLATGAIIGPNQDGDWTFLQYQTFDPQPIPVASIIADLCERSIEDRYDLSDIPPTDTLLGYKLQNPASARSNIDPLLTAFAIYIVDEDGVIKFKKYEDIQSEATISYDELGQAEDGAEPADAMPLNRSQEIDMPRSVAVSYVEPTFDYQTATEKEVRQITEATEDMIVELPMATSSDHAKKVASMILFAKWRAQNTRSFKTSRKYAFLSPGDGVTVEYPRGTHRLWRITSMTDTGVLCEFNVEPGDAELYTQTAIGASGYVGQEVAPLAPTTRLQLLDIPILRDVDNNAGLYAAMAGFGSGWTGAELFVGDDETTLESRGTVSNGAVIGFTETRLGDWPYGIVDESNLLTVNVGNGELASITYEQLISGALNVAAVGVQGRWEILKFRTAESLGSGRFILSGLVRGMRGTEWARGTHLTSDTFVLMTVGGTLRPNFEAGSIGQTKTYRAVSKGRSFNSASSQTYANTAEGLETFSPTNLFRTGSVGGDITMTCVRRTRLSENWLRGIVPLGEEVQAFDFELYTSSAFTTLRRVIASSTRSAVYTAAMQAADGYSSGPLYVRVYQLSGVVGRGRALEATI